MPDQFSEPIIHLDMDAFFVEVERLRQPDLRNRSVVVGGAGPRSVVAAASYEAREHGVRSAMPMSRARRVCPSLVVVPPNHAEYRRVSRALFSELRNFTPRVEALSIDEAFLDVSGLRLHYRDPVEIAQALRSMVRSRLGLPSSAGVAPNKFLAKLASEDAKPDGLRVVRAGAVEQFLHPLPVRALWGVGEATHAALERLGVESVGDLAAVPEATLIRALGRVSGAHLHELARGVDLRPVVDSSETKSISVEHTFDEDLRDPGEIEAEVLRHCELLSDRLRNADMAGRTVSLKIRFDDFATATRSMTVEAPLSSGRDLHATAKALLHRVDMTGRGVRLLGVGASGLIASGAPRQLTVDESQSWDPVSEAIGTVRDRFGVDAVRPARLPKAPFI